MNGLDRSRECHGELVYMFKHVFLARSYYEHLALTVARGCPTRVVRFWG